MINSLYYLIRIHLQNGLGSILYQKKKTRYVFMAVVMGLGGLLLLASMTFNAIVTTSSYQESGVAHYALASGAATALLITLLTSSMRFGASYSQSDSGVLLPLPIRKSVILLSKSLALYLLDFLPVFVFWMPTLVVYSILIDSSAALFFRGLLFLFLMPLSSMGLSYFISWLMFLAIHRLRYPEMIRIILSLFVVIAFMVVYLEISFSPSTLELPEVMVTGFLGQLAVYVLTGSIPALLVLISITVVPYAIGIYLQSRIFGKQPRAYTSSSTELSFKRSNPFISLLKREFRFYFSIPALVVNTLFMPIMALAAGGAFIIFHKEIMSFLELPEFVPLVPMLSSILLAICVFFYTTCSPTCSSISLEKKNLRILKAAPVSSYTIFMAKVLLQVLLSFPPCLFMTVAASAVLGFSSKESLLLILCSLFSAILIALMGLYLNLLFPKMEWTNPVTVVKQSAAVGLMVLGGMVLSTVSVLPAVISPDWSSNLTFLLNIYTIIIVLLCLLLYTDGRRRFSEL